MCIHVLNGEMDRWMGGRREGGEESREDIPSFLKGEYSKQANLFQVHPTLCSMKKNVSAF